MNLFIVVKMKIVKKNLEIQWTQNAWQMFHQEKVSVFQKPAKINLIVQQLEIHVHQEHLP